MSYFSIKDFIKSGRKSLENKNYWSALSVALMLPSMCARIEFANAKDAYMNYKWKDKEDHSKGKEYTNWKDKECYVDFCKRVTKSTPISQGDKTQNDPWLVRCLGDNFAEVLYQLRCDIIHAGIANIYNDNKGIYLMLSDINEATRLSKYRIISIKGLCDTIFNHIDNWIMNNSADNFKCTYVFDTEHSHDDMLLYQRLCDNDRGDYLLEKFEKENAERISNSKNEKN